MPRPIHALAVLLLLLGLAGAAPPAAMAGEGDAYLAELTARARADRLADRRMWRLLLHDRPGRLRPVVSDVDGWDFFLAPTGKTDPAAELDATLAAFFQPPVDAAAGQHPQCRFNARYRWLREQLAFDPERLPAQPCARLETWLGGLHATRVELVYPAAYLNSPPSMFGHTFLRLDNPDKPELLDYALNYAALVPEDEGPLYAAKGLLGFFPGRFTILPYYAKVQSYAELENRDIWEYRLTLTPDEIDRMLRHAWELGPTYFDYFFLKENCSYHLLSLLEVARPELDLTGGFQRWTVPTDTLRVVAAAPGLVAAVRFRPARGTVIRHREAGLPRARVAAARSLASGTAQPGPGDDAAVLDLAHDYLLYLEADRKGDAAALKARRHRVLLARSGLGGVDPSTDVPVPAVRPEQGHGTQRAILATGTRTGHGFVELGYRAAYHDLLDPLPGYDRHAQLAVFDGAVRYRPADGRLALERLTALDILSLAPVDGFFNPRSWKVSAGYRAGRAGDCVGCGTARFNFGPGVTAAVGDAVVYGFAEVDAHYGPRLEQEHALGPGARVGALVTPVAGTRLWLDGAVFRSLSGEHDRVWEVAIGQSVDLGRDRALRLAAEGRDSRFGRAWEGRLAVAAYW